MSRQAYRTEFLSLDTISIINKLYPNILAFYNKHLRNTEVTVASMYQAMRSEAISPDTENLIESSITYELMQFGVDRDTLATVTSLPPVTTLLPSIIQYLSEIKPKNDFDTETLSQLLLYLRLHNCASSQ